MRWWVRLVVTLILAPLLWRLGVAYLASEQGATWSELAQKSGGVLVSVYLIFTIPGLILCGMVLTVSDWVLHKLGLDLLTVLASPLLAWVIAAAVLRFVPDSRVQAAQGAVVLSVIYGLVWGLTIREPRGRRSTPAAETDPSPRSLPQV